jgi:mRNA interferase MazF
MKKGQIVLVPFPFSDLSGMKTRPALVLSAGTNDVIVAFITSRVNRKEKFDIEIAPNSDNGLKFDSLLKLTKLVTLERSLVLGKIGEADMKTIKRIDTGLINLFAIHLADSNGD